MNYEAGDKEYDFYQSKVNKMIVVFTGEKTLDGELLSHSQDYIFISSKLGGEMLIYKQSIVAVDDFNHDKRQNR